jgi:hypothetical protein
MYNPENKSTLYLFFGEILWSLHETVPWGFKVGVIWGKLPKAPIRTKVTLCFLNPFRISVKSEENLSMKWGCTFSISIAKGLYYLGVGIM